MIVFKNKETKTLALAITQRCNLGCEYCYTCTESLDMSREVIKKSLASFVFSDGFHKKVVLLGGEPTLNINNIREVLNYIMALKKKFVNKKIETTINTNATILNEDIQKLYQHIGSIAISIDGMKKTHDAHRRYADGSPSFGGVIKNIRKIKQRYPKKVVINKLITSKSVHNIFEDVLFLYKLNPVSIHLNIALGDLGWDEKKVKKLFQNLRKLDLWIRKDINHKKVFKSLFEKPVQECVISHLAVDVYGNLYPCEILLNMKKGSIGNVITGISKQNDILTCKYSATNKKCSNELCLDCNKICRKTCFSNWEHKKHSQEGELWLKRALEFRSFFIKNKKNSEEDISKVTLKL